MLKFIHYFNILFAKSSRPTTGSSPLDPTGDFLSRCYARQCSPCIDSGHLPRVTNLHETASSTNDDIVTVHPIKPVFVHKPPSQNPLGHNPLRPPRSNCIVQRVLVVVVSAVISCPTIMPCANKMGE